MRELTGHKVNPANDVIKIEVLDEPGAGGANHEYELVLPNGSVTYISFQNGPIGEAGVNGITQEALLAVVIDRLQSFNKGPFPSQENGNAMIAAEHSLEWLKRRTRERQARNVEGTTAA